MKNAELIQFLLAGLVDESGNPLAGGLVTTYEAGTTTPKAIYQDAAATSAQTNPAVLDSRGVLAAYGFGNYKFVIADSLGNVQYTVDNIAASGADFYTLNFTTSVAGVLEFPLADRIGNLSRMDVTMNGVMLDRGTWTATSSTLTLDSGYEDLMVVGTVIEVVEK